MNVACGIISPICKVEYWMFHKNVFPELLKCAELNPIDKKI